MKCVLFNQSVKVLSRAIHSLARIGDEMVVEPFKHGLKLSTVDKSESAYTQFWFPVQSFFYSYKYEDTENPDDLRLKISFKALLTVFKTCHSVDKIVASCTIQIENNIPAMIIKMQFNAGYSKTHSLFISDCVPINANYSSTGRNEIVLPPKILSNALRNFHCHQAEITLAVDSTKTIINNFDDKTLESSGQNIRSQLSLDPGEFTNYRIGLDTAINFTVREIKAMLAFAENVSGVLKITFDEPTKPIVFNILEAGMYEANYILATESSDSMSTIGSSASDVSSTLTASRGRGIRRVLSSEDSTSGGEPKRACTNESRAGTNNNDGNSLNSQRQNNSSNSISQRPGVAEEGVGDRSGAFNDRQTDRIDENVFSRALRRNCDMVGVSNAKDRESDDDMGGNNLDDGTGVEQHPLNNHVHNVKNSSNSVDVETNKSHSSNRNPSSSNRISENHQVSSNSSKSNHFDEKFNLIENILFGEENVNRTNVPCSKTNGSKLSNEFSAKESSHDSKQDERRERSVSYGLESSQDNLRSRLEPQKQSTSRSHAGKTNNSARSEVYSDYDKTLDNKSKSLHEEIPATNVSRNRSVEIETHTSTSQALKVTALRHISNSTNSSHAESSANRIESFDCAVLNEFQLVEDFEMDHDLVSQDTTTLNVCTPLNAEKLKIVFRHCLEGSIGKDSDTEGGKVLVYNSDDEDS